MTDVCYELGKIFSATIIAGKVNYDRWKPVLLIETSTFNRNLELSVKTSTLIIEASTFSNSCPVLRSYGTYNRNF